MPEILPLPDKAGFEAKTPEQAMADLTGNQEQMAEVIPLPSAAESPVDQSQSEGYAVNLFDKKVEEAKRRHERAQQMLDSAMNRVGQDGSPSAGEQELDQLRNLVKESERSLAIWSARAENARNLQDPQATSEKAEEDVA